MKKLRIWATVSLTLAFLGLAALFLSHASLTDIYHGEKDASLEWTLLRLAFLVILLLIIPTIVCTGLVLKYSATGKRRKSAKTEGGPPSMDRGSRGLYRSS